MILIIATTIENKIIVLILLVKSLYRFTYLTNSLGGLLPILSFLLL